MGACLVIRVGLDSTTTTVIRNGVWNTTADVHGNPTHYPNWLAAIDRHVSPNIGPLGINRIALVVPGTMAGTRLVAPVAGFSSWFEASPSADLSDMFKRPVTVCTAAEALHASERAWEPETPSILTVAWDLDITAARPANNWAGCVPIPLAHFPLHAKVPLPCNCGANGEGCIGQLASGAVLERDDNFPNLRREGWTRYIKLLTTHGIAPLVLAGDYNRVVLGGNLVNHVVTFMHFEVDLVGAIERWLREYVTVKQRPRIIIARHSNPIVDGAALLALAN